MFGTCTQHAAPVTCARIPSLPDASHKPSFDIQCSPDARAHTSAFLCCCVFRNPTVPARATSSVELHDHSSRKVPTACRAEPRNTRDQVAQPATHPCVDRETDATPTIHSSSELTLNAFIVARITVTNHTNTASTGKQHPSTDMPTRLMPRRKAPPGEQSFTTRKWLNSVYSQKTSLCRSAACRSSGKVKEAQ